MAKVKFVLGANELQFEVSKSYPDANPIEKTQVLDRTASGLLRVESYGVTINTKRLNLVKITKTDFDGLTDWFDNISDGASNAFTYYDQNADTFTVRMTNSILAISQVGVNRYSGEITLEVVA